MLGFVFGIKSNHAYLSTQHFTVKTDLKILATMFKWKKKSGRLTRWTLCLADYDFDIVYQCGTLNHANFLSRIDNSLSQSNHDYSYVTKVVAFTYTAHNKYTTIVSEQNQHTISMAVVQNEPQPMLIKPPHTTSVTKKPLNIPPLHLPVHEMRLQQYQCLAFRCIIDYLGKNIS